MLARRVFVFVVLVMGLYLALIAPWPGIGTVYLHAYRGVAGTVFQQFGSEGTLWFLPPEQEMSHIDTLIVCKKQGVAQRYTVSRQDAWTTAYLPTAKVIVLILATPISWRRRGIALFFGLCTIQLFIGFRLLTVLVHALSEPSPVQLFEPGPATLGFLNGLHEHFCVSTAPVFLVPVLIWVLVTVRREDLQYLLGRNLFSSEIPGGGQDTVAER
ncbi:MAG: hypothetical protein AABZ47_17270 [Planctomycetota bacterium]